MDEDIGACCAIKRALDRQRPAGFSRRPWNSTESQATQRWLAFQAPDLVVRVAPEVVQPGSAWSGQRRVGDGSGHRHDCGPPGGADQTEPARSPAHETLAARIRRAPLDIARLLAARYPETPSISYIPAVSWVQHAAARRHQRRRVAAAEGARADSAVVVRRRKMFGDRIQLTAVAGAMVFADLSKADGGNQAAARLANEAAALATAVKPDGIAEYGQGWTDDMFMASSILSAHRTRRRRRNAARVVRRPPSAPGRPLQSRGRRPGGLGPRERLCRARHRRGAHGDAGATSVARGAARDLPAPDGGDQGAAGA